MRSGITKYVFTKVRSRATLHAWRNAANRWTTCTQNSAVGCDLENHWPVTSAGEMSPVTRCEAAPQERIDVRCDCVLKEKFNSPQREHREDAAAVVWLQMFSGMNICSQICWLMITSDLSNMAPNKEGPNRVSSTVATEMAFTSLILLHTHPSDTGPPYFRNSLWPLSQKVCPN